MIGDIHVEFKCSRCGEEECVKVDYWFSVDGSPQLRMDTGRERLEQEGWTFTERVGKYEPWQTKYKGLCRGCSPKPVKIEVIAETDPYYNDGNPWGAV